MAKTWIKMTHFDTDDEEYIVLDYFSQSGVL